MNLTPDPASTDAASSWPVRRPVQSAPVPGPGRRYGVASGDPHPDSAIPWTRVTRLRPRPPAPAGEGAHERRPGPHREVEARGLEPGTTYFYRFSHLNGVFGTRATHRWEPQPVVPVSGHAPDQFTMDAALAMVDQFDPNLVLVNLGDCDRVGRFVDMLKSSGRWKNSVVIVLADHSMDWSLPDALVSLAPGFDADPMLAGSRLALQRPRPVVEPDPRQPRPPGDAADHVLPLRRLTARGTRGVPHRGRAHGRHGAHRQRGVQDRRAPGRLRRPPPALTQGPGRPPAEFALRRAGWPYGGPVQAARGRDEAEPAP